MDVQQPVVLAVAGSDPSGGAGVQADVRTLTDCGAMGVFAITAITAQTDDEVIAIHPTPADILTQQLSTAVRGRTLAAVKVGMIATELNIRALAWFLRHAKSPQVVIDPILHSSSGTSLLESKSYAFYRQQLLPLATVITPNLAEAGTLAGMQVRTVETMRTAAAAIHEEVRRFRGVDARPLAVLMKGGHLDGDPIDVLYDGANFQSFAAPRIPGRSPRGTGCRFSSALAAHLALGASLSDAVDRAKAYLSEYIIAQNKPAPLHRR